MSKAMEIINKAYLVAGGIGEYEMPTIPEEFKNKDCPTTIKDILGVRGRKNIRMATRDIDHIVFEYRVTENELLYVALIEHYVDIVIKITRKYQDKASSIRFKNHESYGYDDDLVNEAFVLLHKCIYKYENLGENSSFTSYFLGEVRNHLIETCRRRYFNVVKIPISTYKAYRKKLLEETDEHLIGTQIGLVQRSNACISESSESLDYEFMSSIEEEQTKYYDDVEEAENTIINLLRDNLSEEDYFIFCSAFGLFCEKIKSVEIAEILGVSKPAISKRLKKIKKTLSTIPEIQSLHNYYTSNNII